MSGVVRRDTLGRKPTRARRCPNLRLMKVMASSKSSSSSYLSERASAKKVLVRERAGSTLGRSPYMSRSRMDVSRGMADMLPMSRAWPSGVVKSSSKSSKNIFLISPSGSSRGMLLST